MNHPSGVEVWTDNGYHFAYVNRKGQYRWTTWGNEEFFYYGNKKGAYKEITTRLTYEGCRKIRGFETFEDYTKLINS